MASLAVSDGDLASPEHNQSPTACKRLQGYGRTRLSEERRRIADHSAPGEASSRRRQVSRYLRTGAVAMAAAILAGAVGTAGTMAQDQVEFDLYDLHHLDPRVDVHPGGGGRLHGRAPERQDQPHDPREHGAQGQDRRRDAVRQSTRPVPVLGWRHARRSRSRRAWSGRSTKRSRTSTTQHHPGRSEHDQRGRRCSTACPTTSASSASGTTRICCQQAGIDAPPATWEEFLADVQTLKDAGIVPISLAGEAPNSWTSMFWCAYLSVRICGQEGLSAAITTGDWSGECFVRAGEELKRPRRYGALPARLPGCQARRPGG